MEKKQKVLAYITKGQEPNLELLVFEQKNEPEAGLQVPGGTIEEDELLIDALYREITEETGIARDELSFMGKLHKYNYYPYGKDIVYERNFFQLGYAGNQENWEHEVISDGKDNGMTFQFHFEPIDTLPKLAGAQDGALEFLQ
ncbi:NUDIX hydrolase [Paenisporosarcina sp. TG-14]|uniref:NUDIX hydrolase n=1 Tax=Paenisporosarcina sp. TG-14 TaxID=1231057 RepID=UPI00031E02EC|nr:NUDIX domain-containing protein [Paenisporosarcina sp. TG-14]